MHASTAMANVLSFNEMVDIVKNEWFNCPFDMLDAYVYPFAAPPDISIDNSPYERTTIEGDDVKIIRREKCPIRYELSLEIFPHIMTTIHNDMFYMFPRDGGDAITFSLSAYTVVHDNSRYDRHVWFIDGLVIDAKVFPPQSCVFTWVSNGCEIIRLSLRETYSGNKFASDQTFCIYRIPRTPSGYARIAYMEAKEMLDASARDGGGVNALPAFTERCHEVLTMLINRGL